MTVWDQNGMREVIYYERSHLQLDQMPCHIYILLTMLIHLVPTGKYQRYVRFFMGLLLMVMLDHSHAFHSGKS